jgi:hypothetical protein
MTIHSYANYYLLITKTIDGYTAHFIDSPVDDMTATFTLDFKPEELRDFFGLSGRALRQFRLSDQAKKPPPLTSKQFGVRLYDALFSESVRTQLHRSLDAVAGQGKGLRIRLRLNSSRCSPAAC